MNNTFVYQTTKYIIKKIEIYKILVHNILI